MFGCRLDGFSRYVIVTGRNDLALGMIEMFHWVLNPQWFGVGIVERIPNHIEPIAVRQLRRLVPLVRSESDGLTALTPRDHHKTSPIDPIGDYRSGGHVWQLGLLTRWQF